MTYTKAWDNGSGFGANINITNTGDPLTSWSLTWTWPGNQGGIQGWSANYAQSGQNVTATSLSYNGSLATGASTGIGFNASYSGTNTNPRNFAINGVSCGGTTPTVSLVVSPTSVSVPEGGTATYAVRLSAQPSGNVTVATTAGSGDSNLTVSSGASLTFTTSNWNTNQNVTLAAAEDTDTTQRHQAVHGRGVRADLGDGQRDRGRQRQHHDPVAGGLVDQRQRAGGWHGELHGAPGRAAVGQRDGHQHGRIR